MYIGVCANIHAHILKCRRAVFLWSVQEQSFMTPRHAPSYLYGTPMWFKLKQRRGIQRFRARLFFLQAEILHGFDYEWDSLLGFVAEVLLKRYSGQKHCHIEAFLLQHKSLMWLMLRSEWAREEQQTCSFIPSNLVEKSLYVTSSRTVRELTPAKTFEPCIFVIHFKNDITCTVYSTSQRQRGNGCGIYFAHAQRRTCVYTRRRTLQRDRGV